jgi:hypothetical protein
MRATLLMALEEQKDLPSAEMPETSTLIRNATRGDLPALPLESRKPTKTFMCDVCGTRIRPGQPHIATKPTLHETLEALTVEEYLA